MTQDFSCIISLKSFSLEGALASEAFVLDSERLAITTIADTCFPVLRKRKFVLRPMGKTFLTFAFVQKRQSVHTDNIVTTMLRPE